MNFGTAKSYTFCYKDGRRVLLKVPLILHVSTVPVTKKFENSEMKNCSATCSLFSKLI